MKRKKRDLYGLTIVAYIFLIRCCDAFRSDEDSLAAESIGRSIFDPAELTDANLLQQFSHGAAALKSSSGSRYDIPTGIYPEELSKYRYGDGYGGYLNVEPQLRYDGEQIFHDEDASKPFEIEVDDKLNPFELVNIDRAASKLDPEVLAPSNAAAITTTKTTALHKNHTSKVATNAASELPKRRGEMEYATFVNQPSMRMKEQQSKVNVLPMVEVSQPASSKSKKLTGSDLGDTVFYAVAGVCSLAAVLGIVFASFSYSRLRKQYKQSQFNEYPTFGFGGLKKTRSPDSVVAMDSKLASAAQLYHFQHTKQQIISMENPACDAKEAISDDSEVEEDEGDYSVYECPGLAPTGNMEINNPIFLKPNNGTTHLPKGDLDIAADKEAASADIRPR